MDNYACSVDIGFLLDASSSISHGWGGNANWDLVKNFVIITASKLNISTNGAHFAVTTFSDSDKIRHPINFKDHTNLTSFIADVDRNVIHTGGGTDTVAGLDAALNIMFSETKGMRSNVQLVLFFMTDGQCQTPNCRADIQRMKRNFLGRGIRIIGFGVTASADATEIELLVDRKDYHSISPFDPGLPRRIGICDGMLIIHIDDIK